MYSKAIKNRAKRLYQSGVSLAEISRRLKIRYETLRKWKTAENWDSIDINTIESLERKINQIVANIDIEQLDNKQLLALKRLTEAKERLSKNYKQQGSEIKKEVLKKQKINIQVIGGIREKFLDKLYPYQRRFVEDKSRFRILLKGRQTGFSFTIAGEILIQAIESRRDQIIISASENQGDIILRYMDSWAEELGIGITKTKQGRMVAGGAEIIRLASNWRTVQGYTGDIWFDEFAWHIHPDRIYNLALPIITIGDKKATIISTPFTKTDKFGEIWLDEEYYKIWSRHKIDIEQAKTDGLDVDISTLRSLFDLDTFMQLYMCEFFTDEMNLFGFAEIQDALDENTLGHTDGLVDGGVDIGRHRDETAIALSEPLDGQIYVRYLQALAQKEYKYQEDFIRSLFNEYNIRKMHIDRTGIGDHLTEDLQRKLGDKIVGVWFTQKIKEEIALNAKKIFEERKIRIPNSRDLRVQLYAIKKKATERGFVYDAQRNEKVKHADLAWALMLSIYRLSKSQRRIVSRIRAIFS